MTSFRIPLAFIQIHAAYLHTWLQIVRLQGDFLDVRSSGKFVESKAFPSPYRANAGISGDSEVEFTLCGTVFASDLTEGRGMGIFDWLQKKSAEKSASNIVDGLRPLVVAVRVDTEQAMRGAEQNAALAARMGELDGPQTLAFTQSAAFKEWHDRKAKVADAQKKLFDDLAVWSNLAPERALNDVVLPALFSGQLVAQTDPSFGPVVVAAYRACEAAARQKGVNLEVHTPPAILQLVADAGNLYK